MNSKGHLYISLVKSLLRILGCITTLFTHSIVPISLSFLIAEMFGIIEELVDKR